MNEDHRCPTCRMAVKEWFNTAASGGGGAADVARPKCTKREMKKGAGGGNTKYDIGFMPLLVIAAVSIATESIRYLRSALMWVGARSKA